MKHKKEGEQANYPRKPPTGKSRQKQKEKETWKDKITRRQKIKWPVVSA